MVARTCRSSACASTVWFSGRPVRHRPGRRAVIQLEKAGHLSPGRREVVPLHRLRRREGPRRAARGTASSPTSPPTSPTTSTNTRRGFDRMIDIWGAGPPRLHPAREGRDRRARTDRPDWTWPWCSSRCSTATARRPRCPPARASSSPCASCAAGGQRCLPLLLRAAQVRPAPRLRPRPRQGQSSENRCITSSTPTPACARCSTSGAARAAELASADLGLLQNRRELALCARLASFAELVQDAAAGYAPHQIAFYLRISLPTSIAGTTPSACWSRTRRSSSPASLATPAVRQVLVTGLKMLGVRAQSRFDVMQGTIVSRDRGRSASRRAPAKSAGGTLIGIFIGLVFGALVIAAGAAWYFTRNNPFQAAPVAPRAQAPAEQGPAALPGKPGDRPWPKRDFEFYRILPGRQRAFVGGAGRAGARAPGARRPRPCLRSGPPRRCSRPRRTRGGDAARAQRIERIYLQVGCSNPSDGTSRARLALSPGIRQSAQRTQSPDGRIVTACASVPSPSRGRMNDAGPPLRCGFHVAR